MAAVAAVGRCFTTSEPLCYALQMVSGAAVRAGASVFVHHVAGERNDWADALSRWREPKSAPILAGFAAGRERQVDLQALIAHTWR